MWEHQNGEGMNFGLEELILRQDSDAKGNIIPSLHVNTKIYGQPCQVKIATFEPADNNSFKMNLGDMVAFKTKPQNEVAPKTASKSQPKP